MRAVKYVISVGMLLAAMWESQARAANLAIDDTVEGKITLTHDANWEGGVTSNGTSFGGDVPGSTTATGETASFSGSWIVNSPGSPDPGAGIIYVVQSSDPSRVSDTITASWSTSGGIATISFTIQSSSDGADLGALPSAFAGFGIVEDGNLHGIQGSFRDATTAAAVVIPSNLTVQFGSTAEPTLTPTVTPTPTVTATPTPEGLGQTCSASTQCASGFCQQGVCCNSRCTGAGEACNLPGRVGTCFTIAPAPTLSTGFILVIAALLAAAGVLVLRAHSHPR